jgi:transposase-like protein
MGEYTKGFRAAMVRRMTGTNPVTATALCNETGVAQSTLSRWLRDARSVEDVSKRHKGPSKWSAGEKLRVVAAAEGLEGEALGALLRKEGVHQIQLDEWRASIHAALDSDGAAKAARSVAAEHERQLGELRRELLRKDKALAEAAARLVLRKKLEALWGDEDDDTTPSGESSSSPRSRKP